MNERGVLNQLVGLPESAPMPCTVSFIGTEILALYFGSVADARQFAAVVGLRVSPEPFFHKDFSRRQVSINGEFHGWRVTGSGTEDVPDDERDALIAAAQAEAAVEAGTR